jgi:eukaryotic-like serine/threonine-protein kinase
MPLAPHSRLGTYEILSPLGSGGMGEVYRARDTKLDRDVALKVLSERLSGDPESLERFEREAKAVAALSHPNILAIHDFGVEGGIAYAVTELLEGETLRDRMGGAPVPARKAIDYALQLARGLAAAHDRGIVHRDLKPENLFVTNDGRVKILDFGLARIVSPEAGASLTQSPTAGPGTQPGTVMGTMGYMSPEQVRGRPADQRSDLFAFGAILYEMLSGARAFRGDSAADTMSAILKEDPADLSTTGRSFPPGVERIILHCVEKAPEERFQSARDVAFALEALSGISSSGLQPMTAAVETSKARRWLVPALAIVAVFLAIGTAYIAGRRSTRTAPPPALTFRQLTFRPQTIFQAAATGDGKTLVYSAALQGNAPEVFAMDPAFPEPRRLGLPETELLSVSSKGEMALLTHAKWVAHRLFEGTLAQMPIGGGAPRELMEKVRQADWTPDGKDLAIIREVDGRDRLEYPPGKVLYEVSGYLSDPRFSPSGDRIAFFQHPVKYDDRGSVNVVDLTGRVKVLSDGYWGLEGLGWASNGTDVIFSAGTGYSNFAIFRVSPSGVTTPVLQSAGGLTFHAILPDGRWLVTRDDQQRGLMGLGPGDTKERDLAWMELSLPAALSNDGKTLLFVEEGTGAGVNYAVCLRKTDGSPVVRLGEGLATDLSPDGRWALAVIFATAAKVVLYPTGAGELKHLETGGLEQFQNALFFPDGERVLLDASESGHGPRCYEQRLSGGPPRAITPEGTTNCAISPDGTRVLAATTDGRWSLYPLAGGTPVPVPGILPDEFVSRIAPDGRSVVVFEHTRMPARVTRVDFSDGRRTLLKEIAPPELSGAISLSSYVMSGDGKSYAYSYFKYQTQLFLVDGVR